MDTKTKIDVNDPFEVAASLALIATRLEEGARYEDVEGDLSEIIGAMMQKDQGLDQLFETDNGTFPDMWEKARPAIAADLGMEPRKLQAAVDRSNQHTPDVQEELNQAWDSAWKAVALLEEHDVENGTREIVATTKNLWNTKHGLESLADLAQDVVNDIDYALSRLHLIGLEDVAGKSTDRLERAQKKINELLGKLEAAAKL